MAKVVDITEKLTFDGQPGAYDGPVMRLGGGKD